MKTVTSDKHGRKHLMCRQRRYHGKFHAWRPQSQTH